MIYLTFWKLISLRVDCLTVQSRDSHQKTYIQTNDSTRKQSPVNESINQSYCLDEIAGKPEFDIQILV